MPASPRYKRPVSVLVIVYTRAGRVLVLRRRDPPDFWQSVTGSLGVGEGPARGAARELAEETGIAGAGRVDCGITNRFPIIPPWKARYAPDAEYNTEHVFALELEAAVDVRISPAEHSEYAWLPAREASRRVSSWTNRDAILHIVGNGEAERD